MTWGWKELSEKNQKQAKQPLMYIVQPENIAAEANMQQVAVRKKISVKQKQMSEPKIEEIDTLEETQAENNQIPDQLVQEQSESPIETEAPVYERKTRKSLNQMSVPEKINFFATLPSNIPRTLCQVELSDQTYRGIILGETDGIVHIRTSASSQPVNIKAEDIQAIQPIGF